MIDQKEVPMSVQAQYVTAMKYAGGKRHEVLVKDGVNHPHIEDEDNDEETNGRMTAWIHGSHLTDNKFLNKNMNNITVDIGIYGEAANNHQWKGVSKPNCQDVL
jgi:hypothetical protein